MSCSPAAFSRLLKVNALIWLSTSVATLLIFPVEGRSSSEPGCNSYNTFLHEEGFIRTIGTDGWGMSPRAIVSGGDKIVFVAAGNDQILVLDVSSPSSPQLTGSARAWPALDLDLTGNLLCAVGSALPGYGYSGLTIHERSGSTALIARGTLAISGASRVTAVENIACVGRGDEGVDIVDLSDSEHPEALAAISSLDATDVLLRENVLYVVGAGGLSIVDLSVPAVPVVRSTLPTPGEARSLDVSGHWVFVADQASGVQVVDVSSIESPEIVAVLATADPALSVRCDGRVVFVGSRDRIQVFDVDDPRHPADLGMFRTERDGNSGIEFVGDFLCATNIEGMSVISRISNSTPQPAFSLSTPTEIRGMAWIGSNLCYVETGGPSLHVVDPDAEHSVAEIGVLSLTGSALDVEIRGNHAFVAGAGLKTIDLSDPKNPVQIGATTDQRLSWNVDIAGNRAYVTGWFRPFRVVDISEPTAPAVLGEVEIRAIAMGLAKHPYVYLGGLQHFHLHIVDVSDPHNPAIVRVVDSIHANEIHVQGGIAFISPGNAGGGAISVYDVRDPLNPIYLSEMDDWRMGGNVQVAGRFAFVAGPAGASIYDLAGPRPEHLGLLPTNGAAKQIAIGATVAVADQYGGLKTYAVPCEPTSLLRVVVRAASDGQVVRLDWDVAADMVTERFRVYKAASTHRLAVVAEGTPSNPDNGHWTDSNVEAETGYRYRIGILDALGNEAISDEVDVFISGSSPDVSWIPPAPTPFRDATTMRLVTRSTLPVSVRVYDVLGRLVRSLEDDVLSAGEHAFQWNGRDDRDLPVAAGQYWIRLRAGKLERVSTVVRVR